MGGHGTYDKTPGVVGPDQIVTVRPSGLSGVLSPLITHSICHLYGVRRNLVLKDANHFFGLNGRIAR